jgi:hypothetical protein
MGSPLEILPLSIIFFFFRLLSLPRIQILSLSVLLLLQGGAVDFKEKELLLLKLENTFLRNVEIF